MIKQLGGGICWHEVGTGKTMIMCVAAYEMKRLGLAQKPMIIGLKANVHEIGYGFLVRHTHLFTVALYLFRYFGYGILQGVYEQLLAVVVSHGIGVVGYGGIPLQTHQIGVQKGRGRDYRRPQRRDFL